MKFHCKQLAIANFISKPPLTFWVLNLCWTYSLNNYHLFYSSRFCIVLCHIKVTISAKEFFSPRRYKRHYYRVLSFKKKLKFFLLLEVQFWCQKLKRCVLDVQTHNQAGLPFLGEKVNSVKSVMLFFVNPFFVGISVVQWSSPCVFQGQAKTKYGEKIREFNTWQDLLSDQDSGQDPRLISKPKAKYQQTALPIKVAKYLTNCQVHISVILTTTLFLVGGQLGSKSKKVKNVLCVKFTKNLNYFARENGYMERRRRRNGFHKSRSALTCRSVELFF